ncbi:HPP family protein [Nocardioides sp.]|uniref:HPP family protein n=1 Tax=Nocardioides sp. TaxID=35761 RepID=UPI0027369616|nr:HPP family protein [Nocardioides sp.]MDP3893520.1 HPP family protein [Nocardioides sp.]
MTRTWRPIAVQRYRPAEVGRGSLGALLGILVAGLTARAVPGGVEGLPFIVAPMGATAVLLFAVPASPLAQPWPVLGGNVLSSVVGLTAGRLVDEVLVAAAVGVGAAIGLMMLLGCLHPPGGACALVAATATPAIDAQGFAFAALPVAVNTAALLVVALAVNNATGRRYPHRPPAVAGAEPGAPEPLGVQAADVARAMRLLDQGLDVTPRDVVALVREAETQALDRRLGSLPVRRVMSTDPAVVLPFESIYRARTVIVQRRAKSLPVVDAERRVIGIVSVTDLFTRDLVELEPVESMMTTDVVTLRDDTPVAQLVPLMTQHGYRHLPIVDAEGHLVGMVTRGELIAVLHRALLGDDLAQ